MSPLAPQVNGSQTTFNQNGMNQGNLIERAADTKVTYSMGALYEMRHTESRAPNLGNRTVLALISRSGSVPSMNVPGAFSQNFLSSTMERFQRDRRQINMFRSAAPPPQQRHFSNANNDGSSNFRAHNGERQRQQNHGKFECDMKLSFQSKKN